MGDVYVLAKMANENAERFKLEKAAVNSKSSKSIKEKFQNYFYGALSLMGFALLMGCFFIINLIS